MVPRGRGALVTVASNAAGVPRAGMSAYAASKAAAAMLTRCLGLEVARHGIRCNVVSPGSTDTPMQRQLWTGDGSKALAAAEALDAARTAGLPEPVVAGAVGFRPDAASSLVVPSVVRRADAASEVSAPGAGSGAAWAAVPRPEPERYADAVRRALRLIGDGDLRKVVLARCLELTSDAPVWVPALLARLVRADPAAYAFAVDVTAPGDPAPRTLVGASPELLVSRRGTTMVANPLAGSAPRSGDEAVDRERIARLRASAKDLGEHAHTAAPVAEVLGRFRVGLEVPDHPAAIGNPTMWHLHPDHRAAGRPGRPRPLGARAGRGTASDTGRVRCARDRCALGHRGTGAGGPRLPRGDGRPDGPGR